MAPGGYLGGCGGCQRQAEVDANIPGLRSEPVLRDMEVHGLGLHGLGKGDKGVWLLECHRQETKTKTPKARDERRAAEPKKLQSEHIYLQNKHAILHLSKYKVGGEGWWARLPNSVEKSATPYPQDAMANPPSSGFYSTDGIAMPVLNNMITS